jgi:hypothetical protein
MKNELCTLCFNNPAMDIVDERNRFFTSYCSCQSANRVRSEKGSAKRATDAAVKAAKAFVKTMSHRPQSWR